MDCQIQWRRKLNREKAKRHYKPRPPRADVECESCGVRIKVARMGTTPRWCSGCRATKEDVRARQRVVGAQRRCHRCQVLVPEAVGKPGKAVCVGCRADPRKADANRAREQRRRLRKYGLTQEQYDQLLIQQSGRCPGCDTTDPGAKGWCIDHCHRSGLVRALLCGRCNTTLGLTDENPVVLRRLADLVEQWQGLSEIKI